MQFRRQVGKGDSTSIDESDSSRHPRRSRESSVAREQLRLERFRERDVDGVIRGQILTESPYTLEQRLVGVPVEIEIAKVDERFGRRRRIDLAFSHEAPQRLRDLDVGKMRNV